MAILVRIFHPLFPLMVVFFLQSAMSEGHDVGALLFSPANSLGNNISKAVNGS